MESDPVQAPQAPEAPAAALTTKESRLQAKREKYGVDLQDPDTVTACSVCAGNFGFTRPKKHCKKCGNLVCPPCSKTRAPIPGAGDVPKRVCDFCCALHSEAASASSDEERQVLDWVAAVLRGEQDQGAALLSSITSDDAKDTMLVLMSRLLLREMVRLVPSGRLGPTLLRAARPLQKFTELQKTHLAARGVDMHLQLVCALANHNKDSARLFKTKQEQILAEIVASEEHGLSEALSITSQSDHFWRVWEAALTLAARIIMLDIEAICDAQLFLGGWEDDDGVLMDWVDSDYTLACTEATFQDFFADLQAWLQGDDAFCRVALHCLKLVATLYVERLINSDVNLDVDGITSARIREDVSILTRTFRAYEILPPRDLAPLLRPLHKICETIDAPADTLPSQARVLASTFGQYARQIITGVIYMRTDISRVEEGTLLKEANKGGAQAGECVLVLDLHPKRRTRTGLTRTLSSGSVGGDSTASQSFDGTSLMQSMAGGEMASAAASAARASAGASASAGGDEFNEDGTNAAEAALRSQARAVSDQQEADRQAEAARIQQRLETNQRLIQEAEKRLEGLGPDTAGHHDTLNEIQQLRYQLVAAKQAATLAETRHADARARAAEAEAERSRDEQRERAVYNARRATLLAQQELRAQDEQRSNPPFCYKVQSTLGWAPCLLRFPWESDPRT